MYQDWALTSYIKPVCGKQAKYKCHRFYWKNFYDEKEWRVINNEKALIIYDKGTVPNLRALKQIIDDERKARKKSDYYYPNKFAWDDIEYIILPTKTMVSSFVVWMNSVGFPQSLQTKIITVEHIIKDF